MLSTKTVALTVAVVAILAVSAVGIGLAYQATFTDQTSEESTATGQYLKIADGTDPTMGIVDSIPLAATTYYLNAGIDIDNSTGTPVYYWDLLGAKLTTDTAGKTAVKVSQVTTQAVEQQTAKVYALFYIGAYDITSPRSITDATVSVAATVGQSTGNVPTTKIILKDEAYAEAPADLSALTEVTELTSQSLSAVAADYFVYILAEWTVAQPTAGTESVVANALVLPTVSVKVTATAEDFE